MYGDPCTRRVERFFEVSRIGSVLVLYDSCFVPQVPHLWHSSLFWSYSERCISGVKNENRCHHLAQGQINIRCNSLLCPNNLVHFIHYYRNVRETQWIPNKPKARRLWPTYRLTSVSVNTPSNSSPIQSQSKWLGHFGVFLSPQCWCTRFGDQTAINNVGVQDLVTKPR